MQKLKILFLASNPRDTPILQLDEEIRSISEKIRASEFRDCLDLFSAWAVRADDLLQILNQYKPHIVHFSGHGNEQGEIILINESGVSKPVSQQALTSLFKTLKDNIKLVILNSCYSRMQAEAIANTIDCVIGMNAAIGDRSAAIFAAAFYRAIGFGRTIKEAFDQGITSLLLEGSFEDTTPDLIVGKKIIPDQIILLNELKPTTKIDLVVTEEKYLGDKLVENLDVPQLIEKLSESFIEVSKNLAPVNQKYPIGIISIIFIDVDGLLGINKVYGRDIGDEVIRYVKYLLKKAIGNYEVLRLRAGDQFVVILPELDVDAAMKVAKKCQRMMLRCDWKSIAPDLHITCTYCVAQYGDELMDRWVGRAIYGTKDAKTKNPNQVIKAPLTLPNYFVLDRLAAYCSS
jgi:diguanylate cyclase (GGDEF)-like protein